MRKNLKKISLGVAIIISSGLVGYQYLAAPRYLRVEVLDIGQGDSILITTPQKFQILIDGGPDATVLDRLQAVLPISDNSIDWVLLSHPDADHLAGLLEVVQNYQVQSALLPDITKDTKMYANWLTLLKERGIKPVRLMSRQEITLEPDLKLTILHPTPQTYKTELGANNASIVLRLDYKNICFLFTGDLEAVIEKALITTYPAEQLQCQILKVAHHGSRTSSTPEFLAAVQPRLALISVGKANKYGHPHDSVIYRLRSLGLKILRTDESGTVRLLSDGQVVYQQFPRFFLLDKIIGANLKKVYNTGTIN